MNVDEQLQEIIWLHSPPLRIQLCYFTLTSRSQLHMLTNWNEKGDSQWLIWKNVHKKSRDIFYGPIPSYDTWLPPVENRQLQYKKRKRQRLNFDFRCDTLLLRKIPLCTHFVG
jgi:hypothetical protein